MQAGKAIGIAIAAAGVIVICLTLVKTTLYSPELAVAPTATVIEASTTPANVPQHISIPAAGVDAKVLSLGIVAGNRMQAPASFTDVGWFKYGVAPGNPGIAAMYAHVDNGLGLKGVFKNLDQLKVGDELTITDASGTPYSFKVSDVTSYPYNAVPPAAIGQGKDAQTTTPQVVLITCAGQATHDPVLGFTYDHRLLVTATLVSS